MNESLLEQIKRSPQLPTLPAIAIQVLDLTRKENVDISEIADMISKDPALSSKILRTVNSPFYGQAKQVGTISHALVILGLQAVKTLALGFSLVSNLKTASSEGFDYMLYWKRSIYSGVAGRTVARELKLVQQEEAFLCALLADVGTLVMHRVLGQEYSQLQEYACGDQDLLMQMCREKYGLDHALVGGMLAEQWQLPPMLSRPILQHHEVSEQDPLLRPLVEAVFVAMIIGEVFANPNPAKYILRARTEMATRFKFAPAQIESILAEVGDSTRETAKLFELNVVANRSYQDVLDEANQALIQLTLQTQQQVQEIKRENLTLQEKAATDPLTALANRARFNDFLESHFQRAFQQQRPLAILFIDVDHFKKVNDTFGHQAGDEVLKRLGKLLKLGARNIDLAARYGGEEFALVLTETDSNAAAQLADELRMALQAERIVFEGKAIPVTCSIGVAGTDRGRVFATASHLTNAADRAVYAAKAAGRNCVRLFRPKLSAESAPAPAGTP